MDSKRNLSASTFVSRFLVVAWALLLGHAVAAASPPRYPYATPAAAFAKLGFDPLAPNAAYFVACTDPHVNADKKAGFPAFVIDDILAMTPPPAFLVITGDMICNASSSFGNRPNADQKEKAREEFRLLKQQLDRLGGKLPIHLVPGNHDTYPGERDAALMRQVFPAIRKPYSYGEIVGVSLFFLNAGSSGDFDPEQQAWLRKTLQHVPLDREAILFVHQPALGAVVNERGIPLALRRIFADYRGPLWMLSGHHHRNWDAVFAIGKTTIVQAAMTTCGEVWGGPEKPGYWIYCLRGGKVVGRVFRQRDKGYRVAPLPSRDRPRPIVLPFAGLEGIEKKVFVGEGDREFLRSAKAADVVSWWGYVTDVHYAFPASLFPRQPTRIAVLADLALTNKNPKIHGHVRLSADGKTWSEVQPESSARGYTVYAIPPAVAAAETMHVRVTGPGYGGGVTLGGFAFCGPPEKPRP